MMEVSIQNQEPTLNSDIAPTVSAFSLPEEPQQERETRETEPEDLRTPEKPQRSEEHGSASTAESVSPVRD
jgi:hypothetical protein